MASRDSDPRQPLEETPQMAAAVDDETTVPQLATGGGPTAENPRFTDPDQEPGEFPPTDELVGDAFGAGSPEGRREVRTGAEQPWEPEDLAVARGQDPTPDRVDRARRDLEQEGPAAVEKTVP